MTKKIEGLRRSLLIAAGAFFAYGGWAAYANWDHGARASMISAITQGMISFLVTAFLTLALENVFHRIDRSVVRFVVTALGPQTAVATITATAHYVVGTPEILATMAPSLIVGTVYCFLYTIGLHARARSHA